MNYRAFLTPIMFKSVFGVSILVPSVIDAKDGFWVNRDNKFTRGSDAKYWIPPSGVMYVEKLVNYED